MLVLLIIIALAATVIIALSLPKVLADRKEWKRRQRLSPFARAVEDVAPAFARFAAALVESFTPAVQALNQTMVEFAAALEADDIKKKLTHDVSTK